MYPNPKLNFQPFSEPVFLAPHQLRGAGMVQCWERSPSTNVAQVQCRPGIMWVEFCCWFSSLLRGFFSGFSSFPLSSKINISKFQYDREFEGCGFLSLRLLCVTLAKQSRLLLLLSLSLLLLLLLLLLLNAVTNCQSELLFFPEIALAWF